MSSATAKKTWEAASESDLETTAGREERRRKDEATKQHAKPDRLVAHQDAQNLEHTRRLAHDQQKAQAENATVRIKDLQRLALDIPDSIPQRYRRKDPP
jgi:hypothetical protein